MSRRPAPHLEVLGPEEHDGVDPARPPLLFVPGLGHEAHCWDKWRAAATAAGYPAYAMSLRGHGHSAGRVRRSALSHYRDDVIRVAESLPARPVLVGHSLGGLVTSQVIARYDVPAAVLVATVPSRPALGSLRSVARQHPGDAARIMVGRTLPMRPEYMFESLSGDEVDQHLARCGPESPWAQFQLLLHRRPPLPRNGAPVLVLGSRADRLVPVADVRATSHRYGAELVEFPGIGHNLMQDVGWEAPWAAVAGWLDRVVVPATARTA